MLPKSFEELKQVRKECKRMVLRRAVVSGAATLISVPGSDIAVDYLVLRDLIKAINKRFGLSEAQMDKYDAWTKMLIFEMLKKRSVKLVGKVATKELIIQALKRISKRLYLKQLLRYIPIIGQAASAGMSAVAMRCVGNLHVEDCSEIVTKLLLEKEGTPKSETIRFLILLLPLRFLLRF
jgi:hypothetical protein